MLPTFAPAWTLEQVLKITSVIVTSSVLEVLLFNCVFHFYAKHARTDHGTSESPWKGTQKTIVLSIMECKQAGKDELHGQSVLARTHQDRDTVA